MGNEKERIAVMLGVLVDGRKLPPYVILRRKTMPKEKLPADQVFWCQEKGWMTNELMMDWIKVVWKQRPGTVLNKRGMLVLDAFKHLTQQVKEEMRKANTDLLVISGDMTSQLQVLDVVVNKPFKDHLKQLYNDWLLEGNLSLTQGGKQPEERFHLIGIENVTVRVPFTHFGPNGTMPFCCHFTVHSSCFIAHFPAGNVVTQLKPVNPTRSTREFFVT
jgi:hypothetical protein